MDDTYRGVARGGGQIMPLTLLPAPPPSGFKKLSTFTSEYISLILGGIK